MKKSVVLIACMLSLTVAARCAEPGRSQTVYQPGEELRYSVKWKFFRLGTVTMRAERDTIQSATGRVKLTMIVESNPDVSFIELRELNESLVMPPEGFALDFYARHQDGDDIREARQHYEPTKRMATYTLTDMVKNIILQKDTSANVPPFVEGSALFFKARALSQSTGIVRLPTMIMGEIQNTTLDYHGDIEYISIDAYDRDIRTRKFSGRADWTGGTAGMSGDFSGWLSDDAAAVPIRAEMKIVLGSIDLELEHWTRPGWIPPTEMLVAKAE
jgi:hypothetical protein